MIRSREWLAGRRTESPVAAALAGGLVAGLRVAVTGELREEVESVREELGGA